MVVNAGLLFRIGILQRLFLDHGPAGVDPNTIARPFLTLWSVADYLLPLVILEVYLHAKDGASVSGRLTAAIVLLISTVAMGMGFIAATTAVWLPRVRSADDNRGSIEHVAHAHGVTRGSSR
jgi:hypothetical protein